MEREPQKGQVRGSDCLRNQHARAEVRGMLVLGSWVFPRVHTSRISACAANPGGGAFISIWFIVTLSAQSQGQELHSCSLSVRALQCRRQCPQQKYVHLQWRLVALVRLPPDGGRTVSGARTKDVLCPTAQPQPQTYIQSTFSWLFQVP